MKKLNLPSFIASITGTDNRMKAMKTFVLTFFLGCISYSGFAQVTVTPGSGGTNICSSVATSTTTLGTITIAENNPGDFAVPSNTITLVPPAGWQFTGLGSVTTSGGDVTFSSSTVAGNFITLNFFTSGTTNFDHVFINGLGVQATSSLSGPGNITASSVTNISGISTGVTNFGSLSIQQAVTPSVSISASPSNVVCAGTLVTFTPAPSSATSPSYQWYVNGSCGACIPSPTFSSNSFSGGETVQALMSSFGSCQTTSTAFSNPITMTVNSNPTITLANASPLSLCVGGTVNLTSNATGGFGGYTFTWNGPGPFSTTGQNVSNTNIQTGGAGIYTVTVTDANLCRNSGTTGSVTVHTNPSITAIAASPLSLCVGATLNLTSTVTGGGGSNSYTWTGNGGYSSTSGSPNATETNIQTTNAGIYTLVVTDLNTCTVTASTSAVTVNTNPTIIAAPIPASLCVGATLNLNSTPGGTGTPFSYVWSGPGFTSFTGPNTTETNIQTGNSGIYSVVITDIHSCTATSTAGSVTVHSNPIITAIGATPNPLCVNATLNLTSTSTGGGGGNSYTWTGNGGYSSTSGSPNATETNIQTTNAGIYTLVVTDLNTCTVTASTSAVTVNTNPTISASATPLTLCSGNTLTLNSTPGGTGTPFSYVWNGPGFTSNAGPNTTEPNIQTSNSGIYSVVISDIHSCTATATTGFVTVNPTPSITASATPNPICVGNTLTLQSFPVGGSGGNIYAWNGPSFSSGGQNASNLNITTAGAGVYTVTVTDVNLCQASAVTLPVTVNTNPTITASASPNPLCVGKTLALSSTPSGGSTVFPTYAWTGPDFIGSGQNPSIGAVATTDAGVYSVTVTDSHGCMASATTASVTVNTNPTIAVFANPNPICAANTLSLTTTPAGGSGTYSTFAWTGPNNFTASGQNTSVSNIVTADAGVYSVTVTDNNGCSGSGLSPSVIVNTNPTITASVTPTPICVGNTLNLSSTAAGGSNIYNTYAWSGPGYSSSSASPNATNAGITTGGAGVYTVTVTDSHGCMASATTPFVVVNTNPVLTTTVTPNPICVGNTLNLESTPGGGTSGFYPTFVWHGPNSFVAGGQNTTVPTIGTSGSGIYSVTVTDGNGCVGNATTALVIVFTNPVVTASVTPNPLCVGSTLALSSIPSGGGGSYSYAWSGPNTFSATTQTTNVTSITTAGAGVYSITVTDNNGCMANATTPIIVVNTNPTITASVTPNPICVGNTLNLNSTPVAGSGGSFTTFAWTGPTLFSAAGQNTTRANMLTTGAGVYTVVVTDNNGCKGMGFSPIVVVNTNPTITATVTPNPICVGNTVNLNSTPTAGSGLSFTSFAWSGPGYTGAGQNTTNPNITTGGAGVYSVTVTDNNGCTGSGTTGLLVVHTNPIITATVTPNPICVGSTLALNATRTGGAFPFAYAWSGPAGYTSTGLNTTSANIQTSGAGVYSVTVTDNNGCMASATTASLTVNTNPTITAAANPDPICVNSTLALTSTPVAGSGSSFSTFVWNGPGFTSAGQNTTEPNIQTSNAGIYSVTVTDNNGCSGMGTTLFVTVHTNPAITATVTPNPICVGNTLALNSTPAGGGGLYTYVWSGPNLFTATTQNTTNPSITTAGAGIYSVVVTDNNGCSGSVNTSLVTVNTNPTITANATPNPICTGNTLALNSTPVEGSGSSFTSFAWSGPGLYTATTQNASNASIQLSGAGVYSVSVTDNNGCQGFATTTTVTVNASPIISATGTPNPICAGNTLALNSNPSGGSGAYSSFAWNGPDGFSIAAQNTSITGITTASSGVYSVTVTDNNGCMGSATTASVVVNALPTTFSMSGGGSYCLNGPGVHIGLNGSQVGVNYQLFYGSTPGVIVAGTGSPIDFGLYTVAGLPYTAVATNTVTTCTSNMLSTVSVTILPLPAVFNVTGGGTFCANGAGEDVGLDGSAVGFTYQLYDGATPIGSAMAGTGHAIDFGLQTTVATYTVLASDDISHCNNEMNNDAVIDTFPLPAVFTVAGGGTLCAGTTGFFIGLSGSVIGFNYQLYNGSATVGAPVAGTGGALNFGIFNTAGTYTVTAINPGTGCQKGMAGNAVFIVNPLPIAFNVTGGGGYCAVGGTVVHVGLSGSELNTVKYQLYNSGGNIGAPITGTGGAIDFGPQPAAGTYSVLATTIATSCTNNMLDSAVVVINNNPTAYTVTGTGNYCVGGAGVSIGLTGSDLGVDYQPLLGGSAFGASVPGTGVAGAFTIGLETTVGTYSVLATNHITGCTTSMLGSAVVDTNSLPAVFTLVGGGAYCAGGAGIDLGLSNSVATVSYQLYNGSSTVGSPSVTVSGGAIDFGFQTAAGTYSVLATDLNNCMSGMTGHPVVVMNPLPDAITGAATVCTGAITTFSDDSTGGTWSSNAAGIAGVGSLTGVVSGVTAGSTTITYSLPTTCFVTASITVNQTPGNITGNNNVCAGSSTPLSDALAGGTWSNTALSIATVDPSSGNVFGVSAGSDNITYSMPTGCFVISVETVNPLPVVPPIGGATSVVCQNSSITYTDGLSGGTWSSSNAGIASVDPATGAITGISNGSATITYTFTTGFGCSSFVSQGVTINPVPGVAIISGPADVCAGASVTLSDATTGGVWSSSNTNATVSSTGVVTGIASGSAVIVYTVSNGFGCSSTTAIGLPVGNAMPASAVLPVGSATLCGGPVSMSVVSSGGTPSSYQWLYNGTVITGADSATYMADSAGFYTAILGNGTCELTLTGSNIVAPPAPVITYDSVTNILYTGSFTTYEWFLNGHPISGANSSVISATGDGVYSVVVSDGNGCHDTASFTIGVPTGVSTQQVAKNIRIYPNPATSILYIDAPGKVFVSVLSPDGKVMIERKEAVSLNVSQLADGMYMIMIYDENNTLLRTDKFVKMQ